MGLISKEQAAQILDKLISIDVYSAARWSDVVETVNSCVYAPPIVDDEPPLLAQIGELFIKMEKLERNMFTLESNHYKLQTGSDNDFSIVHQRIDKALKHNDQLDVWLHALEKAVMDIKGLMMGRMAVPNFVNPGYLTKEKPQREDI